MVLCFTLKFVQTAVTSLLLIAFGLFSSAQTRKPSPSGFASIAARADAARDAERLEEALALYRKALALRPAWAEGWWSLGTIQYDRNAYAEAAHAFQKVTVLAPKNGTAYVMLGLSEFEIGHDELALPHIQKGKNLGLNTDVELRHVALYHEGVLLQRKGKFEAAQETLQQLCLQGVQNDHLATALGMTLLRLTTKEPPAQGSADADIVARIGRAECLAGQKKYDEAKPGFEAVVSENPNYPNIHYAYGLFLLQARDLAGGVEQLKQEIANNPDHVFARLQIAAARYKEDSAAGLPYAEEAVKLDPRLPLGHYLVGLLLLDVDQPQRAIPELETAEKVLARDPKVYLALGSAYSRVGRKQDAARARATFERLSKEREKSELANQEKEGTAERKPGNSIDTSPPQ